MQSPHKFLSALVAGALLVAGCGDSDSRSTAAAGNPVDRAFVAQMIPHHQSAVQMAQIAQRRGQSAFVKQLADDIVRTQSEEIATLRAADRRLRAAGVQMGSLGVPEHMMGMDDDPASLKSAKPFDRAFMRMMIAHHEGAIVMARAELAKGKDRRLKTVAQNIITAQQREIRQMRKTLGESGTVDEHETDSMHGSAAPPPQGRGHGQSRASHRQGRQALDAEAQKRRGAGSPDMPHVQTDR
ncbi:MAG: DUF305 domain-containing protein [Actinobacteria bacterium]|nr:DUF305 domain-containing protein [Actinomycetota bacterium]